MIALAAVLALAWCGLLTCAVIRAGRADRVSDRRSAEWRAGVVYRLDVHSDRLATIERAARATYVASDN